MLILQAATTDLLLLDSNLRDWVLIPILYTVFIATFFRLNVTKLVSSEKPISRLQFQEKQQVSRSQRLRQNCNKIPLKSFAKRKEYFVNENGVFGKVTEVLGMEAMAEMNMEDMMKKNIVMIAFQILIMSWVNYFFSGFVLVKFPFPLTLKFKLMLQRGIERISPFLDVTYVSSLSWYFLIIFGLQGVNSLLLGGSVPIEDESTMMMNTMLNQQQQINIKKLILSEKEDLLLLDHSSLIDSAEDRLLSAN